MRRGSCCRQLYYTIKLRLLLREFIFRPTKANNTLKLRSIKSTTLVEKANVKKRRCRATLKRRINYMRKSCKYGNGKKDYLNTSGSGGKKLRIFPR
jgi:hypothetical protein